MGDERMEIRRVKTRKSHMLEKRTSKKLGILALCIMIILCILAASPTGARSTPDELLLVLLPDKVDFSTICSNNLNPFSMPYLTAANAVTAKVEASCRYDLTVKADGNLTATNAQGQVLSTIPINNLYWQWTAQPGWHPFALSSQIVEAGVVQTEKEYSFDYKIFSETNGLGWDIKPGEYKTTITYSALPSP